MSELSLQCNTCHESTPLQTSTSVTQRGTSYDINRRAVYQKLTFLAKAQFDRSFGNDI